MPLFLAVQSTYTDVTLALYQGEVQCGSITDSHKNASSLFLCHLDTLLRTHNHTFKDISFITVNAGPGPFTTLRTVISTLNGLSFGQGTPLIPLNGLELFLRNCASSAATYTIALMNAYCDDVYFGILTQATGEITTGTMNIDAFLQDYGHLCQSTAYTNAHFIGNGVELHKEKIARACHLSDEQLSNRPVAPSINALALQGLTFWKQHLHITRHIEPLYLKAYSTKTSVK